MFSSNFKDKIKQKINLLELIKEYTDLKPAGDNIWQGRCPHPDHDDTTPSFRVWKNNDNTWSWACMGCHVGKKDTKDNKYRNYGSDCFAFVQWMSDHKNSKHIYSFTESIMILADKYNIPYCSNDKNNKIASLLEKNYIKAKCFNINLSNQTKKYLYNRGLDDYDIQKWCIGSNLFKSGFRITFPLFDSKKNVLGFSSRLISKQNNYSKYINSKESECFHKRSFLYGIHLLDESCDEIRITEGVFDVILSNKYNTKNVVATLGTAFTKEHVSIIKHLNKKPVFCLDGDKAGQRATYNAVKLLAEEGIYSKICILPNNMDLADLANQKKNDLEKYIQDNSLLYFQFLLKDYSKLFDSKLDELRLNFLPKILDVAKSVNTKEEKIIFNNFIQERFGIKQIC